MRSEECAAADEPRAMTRRFGSQPTFSTDLGHTREVACRCTGTAHVPVARRAQTRTKNRRCFKSPAVMQLRIHFRAGTTSNAVSKQVLFHRTGLHHGR